MAGSSSNVSSVNGDLNESAIDVITDEDKKWLDMAMECAEEALALPGRLKEVPVGCVLVQDGQCIAKARNEVNETRNATRHAELVCLGQCSEVTDLSQCTVYVTVEPCAMCAAALYCARVRRIVFGCKNDRFGGATVVDVAALLQPHLAPPMTVLQGGYRAEDAMALLQAFYRGQNPNTVPSTES